MAKATLTMHGPDDFERLLERAGVSEREAQAVRSVALSMTAAEVAPFMGVSASTVGSYRQRAYAKLGVPDRSGFLRLPEVAAWIERLNAPDPSCASEDEDVPMEDGSGGFGAQSLCLTRPDEADSKVSERGGTRDTRKAPVDVLLLLITVTCLSAAVIVFIACVATPLGNRHEFLTWPQGTVPSEYGEIPNVIGMRADAAASQVAQAGFCPEFKPYISDAEAGAVLEIGDVGSADDLPGGISHFSWDGGCTACYERGSGFWSGYVTLVVSV